MIYPHLASTDVSIATANDYRSILLSKNSLKKFNVLNMYADRNYRDRILISIKSWSKRVFNASSTTSKHF
jgi:hypothetical protein